MEFDLEREIKLATEAYLIEYNIGCTRRYSHEELADSFRAIRQVNEAAAKERT